VSGQKSTEGMSTATIVQYNHLSMQRHQRLDVIVGVV